METEYVLPLWQNCDFTAVSPFQAVELGFQGMDAEMSRFEFHSPTISMGNLSDTSFSVTLSSPPRAIWGVSPFQDDDFLLVFPVEQYSLNLPDIDGSLLDTLLVDMVDDVCEWMPGESNSSSQFTEEDDSWTLNLPSVISSEPALSAISAEASIVLPSQYMEVDDQLNIFHLLKAYGEAREANQQVLAGEISSRLTEKCSPTGTSLERVAHYMIRASDGQGEHLSQSMKNLEAAFHAFYQIYPVSRFAHFTANSLILDAIPEDTHELHIIDFDIGEGVQWPPLLEELVRRGQKEVRLTSLRWMEADCGCGSVTERQGGINRWMTEHAQSLGLRLKMAETNIQGLVAELNKSKGKEWLAFNCMMGLPHIRKRRDVIHHVTEFLKVAKSFIGRSDQGIITVGDGIGMEDDAMRERNGYGAFLEEKLVDLQALFETMEIHFPGPGQFTEARRALESIFMGPYVSSLTNYQDWEESGETSRVAVSEMGLEARRISKSQHQLVEAKELVRLGGGESSCWVTVEGAEENRMALGYRGSTFVRISSWT
ncbi:protein NODULATION SIGNALING PATHWAY 2-like [Rhodamnia argentea]|uniref:Protein NODULATION SIGNALING PATHWAY 2-like n=1 Tax=Rhodamnia argentea TaxID=178133 RepID=A0A8B8PTL5_9MYRT|nr:protein NODULATION SIGNALING PATHWAY 2-like [Rhodamnia argentea]